MSGEDWISGFLAAISAERGAAQNTLDAYARDLEQYESLLVLRERDFADARQVDIESCLADLASRDYAASSRARKLSAIRRFHRFLFLEGLREDDPSAAIPTPRKGKSLPKTLSVEDVDRLLLAARAKAKENLKGARLICLVEMLYATGMRVSELVTLPVSAVRRDPKMIRVKGKGGKERLTPLSEPAREALSQYLTLRDLDETRKKSNSPFLFNTSAKAGHLTRVRFFQILKQLAAEAGIDPAGVSPHTIRHAFASHLLANGADLRVIQKLLGHADIATTEIYTHVMDENLRALVLEKHPLARGETDDL